MKNIEEQTKKSELYKYIDIFLFGFIIGLMVVGSICIHIVNKSFEKNEPTSPEPQELLEDDIAKPDANTKAESIEYYMENGI